MLSVYGMTINVINFKVSTIESVLSILEDILDEVNDNLPEKLTRGDIISLLHDFNMYFVRSAGDEDCIIRIKFPADDKYDIYKDMFKWYIIMINQYDLSRVFKRNNSYNSKYEFKVVLQCLMSIMYREDFKKRGRKDEI